MQKNKNVLFIKYYFNNTTNTHLNLFTYKYKASRAQDKSAGANGDCTAHQPELRAEPRDMKKKGKRRASRWREWRDPELWAAEARDESRVILIGVDGLDGAAGRRAARGRTRQRGHEREDGPQAGAPT